MSTREKSLNKVEDKLEIAEHVATYAERDGFRVVELKVSPSQEVPWHFHSHISDTFYVLNGEILISTQSPDDEKYLTAGQSCVIESGRPHRVTTSGTNTATFLVLQGIGEYDYIPVDGVGV